MVVVPFIVKSFSISTVPLKVAEEELPVVNAVESVLLANCASTTPSPITGFGLPKKSAVSVLDALRAAITALLSKLTGVEVVPKLAISCVLLAACRSARFQCSNYLNSRHSNSTHSTMWGFLEEKATCHPNF